MTASQPPPPPPRSGGVSLTTLTIPGLYLLVLAGCGWLVLIANLFGIAGASGWIFPVVADIPGLAASTALLGVMGLTPIALRQLVSRQDKTSS